MNTKILVVFSLLLTISSVQAQKSKSPSLEELQRNMMEMQKQLFQEFGNLFQGSESDVFKWDTTYNFQFDTTFGGQDGNMGSFFRFSPFGTDSLSQGQGFPNLDQLFRQFLGDEQPGQWYGYPEEKQVDPLEETGDIAPEEKLRLLEEDKTKGNKEKPHSKKSKIKTIRI